MADVRGSQTFSALILTVASFIAFVALLVNHLPLPLMLASLAAFIAAHVMIHRIDHMKLPEEKK